MRLTETQTEDTERWFIRRGVPHFIADYSAADDVLTRATPVLVLIFLTASVAAIDLDWPAWGIALGVLGGFILLVAAWVLLNWLRKRPLLALPDHIGPVEITAFLVVPAILPIIFGADFTGVAIALASQAALLGVVYVATSYAVVAIAKWAFVEVVKTLGQTFVLFAKGLPLLLLGFMFIFINAEAWQSAGRLDRALLGSTVTLFVLLATVFLIVQIPRELSGLATIATWAEAVELAEESPLHDVPPPAPEPPQPPPLTKREWGNVGLVVFVSQAFRIIIVALLVGAFFVVLGLLVIRPETIELWTGNPPELWWGTFTLFGSPVQMTAELFQVSVFLAAFAGLYFSVYSIVDGPFRNEFFEDVVHEMRENLAVRALYRAMRSDED